MSLEYIFRVLILTVVAFVLISFVYGIVKRSESRFNLCFAPFCKPETSSCETKIVEKENVNDAIFEKYLSNCLSYGRDLKKDCTCYMIKLNNPFDPSHITLSYAINECTGPSKTMLLQYNFADDKVHVIC